MTVAARIIRASRRSVLLTLVISLGALVLAPASGAQAVSGAARPVHRVAVWVIPPFIEKSADGHFTGFSIDLLRDIADEAGFDVEYVEVDSVTAQLDAVRDGRADVAISAISITSGREATVDFSSSMFESGIQAMVSDSGSRLPVRDILADVFSPVLLVIVALMFLGTLLTGVFVWAWERRQGNDHFTTPGLLGAFDGIWWATVTLFTIGYGDMVPRRVLSRIVTMVWIFFGLLMVATLTAEVTASVTVDRLDAQITSIADLAGREVITYPGTTSWDYLRSHGMDPSPVESLDDAYEQVRSGAADAFVFDSSFVGWLAAERGGVRAAGPIIQPENYGLVMAQGSPLTESVDRALLRLREDGTYERLKKSYFGAG